MLLMRKTFFHVCLLCLFLYAGCARSVKESSLPYIKKSPVYLTLPSVEGTLYSLESLRGTAVFVAFFSTWCRPCPIVFDRLLQVQAALTENKVQIVAISVDHDPRFLDMYAETMNLPFPVLQSTQEALENAGIGRVLSVPAILLLDAKGFPRGFLSGIPTTRELAKFANRL